MKIKDIMQFKGLEDLDFTKRGGLLPVIVQDQMTKDILMLAYVNR
jgi:phosphoribosyl-AMP cyclohydrolase